MTRTTTLAAFVVALMLATTGLAAVGSAATTDAGQASTAATSPAPLAQETTEEENESDDGEMGNETEMDGNETDNATASITFTDQTFNGSAVVVNETNLSEGGFVAVFNEDRELVGNSSYLESGEHENVTVEVNVSTEEALVLVAAAHMDTNDNETFDFNATKAAEVGAANVTDAPYMDSGAPVSNAAYLTPENASTQRTTAALRPAS